MAIKFSAHDSIDHLPAVGPAVKRSLERLGIITIADLLTFLPYRSEDRSQVVPIKQLRADQDIVIHGQITSVSSRKSKRGALIIQATLQDVTGKINCLWFNQRYLLRLLKEGDWHYLYGQKKLNSAMGHPFMVRAIVKEPEKAAIYHTTAGIAQGTLKRLVRSALSVVSELETCVPPQYCLPSAPRSQLLAVAHQESDPGAIEAARQELAWEELIVLAASILNGQQAVPSGQVITADLEAIKALIKTLPFPLTDGQKRTAWQVIKDMGEPTAMRRLLYGEVGSGKTMVALLTALSVVRAGYQVAILCPTTALAGQQKTVFEKYLAPFNITVGLLMGDKKDKGAESAHVIVGTQALLQKSRQYQKIGLIIIDEQHRFGVKDRQELFRDFPNAHLLMMTATPIPRSLSQTIFGTMSISYLLEKPTHQQPVETKIVSPRQRRNIEQDIACRLQQGEPGYVICPLIESTNTPSQLLFSDERKTVEAESIRLKKLFPSATIATLHGKLKSDQKQTIVSKFRAGEIDILVSTTVVEVGIDNPDATWILVEDAERFGLSQLHQLRGRVGRGQKQSVCYFIDNGSSPFGTQRLAALAKSTDGLELAEYDLSLRGPGELIGVEQSGLPKLRYANWSDLATLKKAFAIARKIVDDGLDKYPRLAQAVAQRSQDITFG